jgi:RimJ/RimL family protein N-acetyltransferase
MTRPTSRSPADPVRPFRFDTPIATERLRLRLFAAGDLDDLFAYESRDDVSRFMLYDTVTRDRADERLARRLTQTALENDGDSLTLAIELPAGPGSRPRVIGDVDLVLRSAANGQASTGWVLHPDFQGLGYAAEAESALLDLAFGPVGLHRVFAELDPRNAPSVALCERLGMRREALFVEDVFFKGEWGDTGVYAVLAREWHARRGIPPVE